MQRVPSDSEERETMRRISKNIEETQKKLRRSRRKVEKLEITLLSLNAGLKSQARKRGEDTRQKSQARKRGEDTRLRSQARKRGENTRQKKEAGQGSRTNKQGNYLQ